MRTPGKSADPFPMTTRRREKKKDTLREVINGVLQCIVQNFNKTTVL
jgi:hypothetical protein